MKSEKPEAAYETDLVKFPSVLSLRYNLLGTVPAKESNLDSALQGIEELSFGERAGENAISLANAEFSELTICNIELLGSITLQKLRKISTTRRVKSVVIRTPGLELNRKGDLGNYFNPIGNDDDTQNLSSYVLLDCQNPVPLEMEITVGGHFS